MQKEICFSQQNDNGNLYLLTRAGKQGLLPYLANAILLNITFHKKYSIVEKFTLF